MKNNVNGLSIDNEKHRLEQEGGEYKDVVIIGNGPSGIALSYILDGNFPHYNQLTHPDELLTARLKTLSSNDTLLKQDLKYLSFGLEGRSTNPVSLLVDALEHPNADLGLQHSSLLTWKRESDQKMRKQIDHVVLGKGPPGGSWHFMDPHILTLSLGSWMALPGLPFSDDTNSSNQPWNSRTSAGSVANYYLNYVKRQNLEKYFESNTVVTEVKAIKKCKHRKNKNQEDESLSDDNKRTIIDPNIIVLNKLNENNNEHNIINKNTANINNCKCCIESKRPNKKCHLICCKCCCKKQEQKMQKSCTCLFNDCSYCDELDSNFITTASLPEMKDGGGHGKLNQEVCSILDRSQSFTCDKRNYLNCTRFCYFNEPSREDRKSDNRWLRRQSFKNRPSFNDDLLVPAERNNVEQENNYQLGSCINETNDKLNAGSVDEECKCDYKWQITGFNCKTKLTFTHFSKAVVLATGSSDRPNRLGIHGEDENPEFILHNLRDLENAFDGMSVDEQKDAAPILVIGAGLSAADAIIVARNRSLPVLHVFRRKNASLDKQLPENMYPEYHKIHKMMSDSNASYDLYTALPEHRLIEINSELKEATLENAKTGTIVKYKVSFIAILIGSRPDLNFLPFNYQLGVNKQLPIDCKTNPVDINPFTHQLVDYPGLYALGPLAGDNFVRFIPGGAVAIASDLFKKIKNKQHKNNFISDLTTPL